jgi:hypothetical protein
VVQRNQEYCTDRAARMDYPTFIVRQLPIGSGAVERSCTTLIAQREKGAGMRWSAPGAQQIANLRALDRSAPARWAVWWASHPLRRLRLLPPLTATRSAPAAAPAGTASAIRVPADPAPLAADLPPPALPDLGAGATAAAGTPPPATATRIATAGTPWGKPPRHRRRQASSHKRSA